MKVALVADARWLEQERGTLRRLIVGLVDESVRIVRVAPVATSPHEEGQWMMSAEALWYRPTPWRWLRDRQIRAMAGVLRELDVDVIHALDGSLAPCCRSLASSMGVPVVVSVWSQEELEFLKGGDGATPCGFVAGSRALERSVRGRIGGTGIVECIPPGVYATSAQPRVAPFHRGRESVGCVIVGNGRMDAHYRALLEGIARAGDALKGVLYFSYATDADQHGLWQEAERMGLLEQVSLVPCGTEARPLLTQADALLIPQPLGAVRTVVLEAMCAARPVLAVADPHVDHLVDGDTACVLPDPSAELWSERLCEVAGCAPGLAELGQRARRYVIENHKASAFASRLNALYRRLAVPEAIPFST